MYGVVSVLDGPGKVGNRKGGKGCKRCQNGRMMRDSERVDCAFQRLTMRDCCQGLALKSKECLVDKMAERNQKNECSHSADTVQRESRMDLKINAGKDRDREIILKIF